MAAQPKRLSLDDKQVTRLCIIGTVLITLLVVGSVTGSLAVAAPSPQAPIVNPDAVTTPAPIVQGTTHADAAAQSYVVKAGDTLWSVALEIGLDITLMPTLCS